MNQTVASEVAEAAFSAALPHSTAERATSGDGDDALEALPDYADALLAYHRSHQCTLRTMMSRLPIGVGHRTLDVATGDGTYAMLMARRGAEVVALDQDSNYLELAARRAARRGLAMEAVRGDACALPFPDWSFDGAFCAQSFYSISDVSRVLAEMRRVVKPGGWVGVLENDSLHHVLLPWAPGLEVHLRLGQYLSLTQRTNQSERFYIGRRLLSVMREAHLDALSAESFATQHTAPLSDDALTFLREHALGIIDQARDHVPSDVLQAASASCDPASPNYLFGRPDFSATVLDLLVWGRKPNERGPGKPDGHV